MNLVSTDGAAALNGRRIVLGVTGSVAAFKAAALASQLVKAGADVDVILTSAALRFIAPLTFQAITRRPALTDLFDAVGQTETAHLSLGQNADALVICPASAATIARLAHGLADDLLGTTALALRGLLVLVPAMETSMYDHPATQSNLTQLRQRGAQVLGPAIGRLASGQVGLGRMVEPGEVVSFLTSHFSRARDLAGLKVVVTAGGTREAIDAVRYITNRSSGKMGYALADAALDRGAEVTLVSAPTALTPPAAATYVEVESARQMEQAVHLAAEEADIIVMAAAVSDFRSDEAASRKLKRPRNGSPLTLRLVQNPDILAGLASSPALKVGFAAETEDLERNGRAKLREKSVDLIVANDVSAPGSGFGSDTNQVILVSESESEQLPLLSKRAVADRIFDKVLAIRSAKRPIE